MNSVDKTTSSLLQVINYYTMSPHAPTR